MGEVETRAGQNAIDTIGLSTAFGRLSAASPARAPSAVDADLLDSFAQLLDRPSQPPRRSDARRDVDCEASDCNSKADQSRERTKSDVVSQEQPTSRDIDVDAAEATSSGRDDENRTDRLSGVDAVAVENAAVQPLTDPRQPKDADATLDQPIRFDSTRPESIGEFPDESDLVDAGRSQSSTVLTSSHAENQTDDAPKWESLRLDSQISSKSDEGDGAARKNGPQRRTLDRAESASAVTADATHSLASSGRGKRVEISGQSAASTVAYGNRLHRAAVDGDLTLSSLNAAGTTSATVDSAALIEFAKLNSTGTSQLASSPTNVLDSRTNAPHSVGSQNAAVSMAGETSARMHFLQAEPGSTGSERARSSPIDQFRLIQRVSKAFQHLGREGGAIRLRLAPPELGTLQLEMQIHDRSILARIQTDTETASAALREHLPELRQRLESLGMRIERIEVQTGLDDRGDEAWQGADTPEHGFHQSGRERGSIAVRPRDPSQTGEKVLRVVQGVEVPGTPPSALEGVDIRL